MFPRLRPRQSHYRSARPYSADVNTTVDLADVGIGAAGRGGRDAVASDGEIMPCSQDHGIAHDIRRPGNVETQVAAAADQHR